MEQHNTHTSKLVEGPNVRTAIDPEKDRELTESIERLGIVQPIVTVLLEDGTEQIIAGFRRFRCGKAAGLTEFPTICLGSLADTDWRSVHLVENIQRSDLNPMDAARGAAWLVKNTGGTAAEAAKRLGVSEPTMSRWLTLAAAPPEIQAKVERGELGIVAACQAVRMAANVLAGQAGMPENESRLSPKALVRKVNRLKRAKDRATPRPSQRITLRTADGHAVGLTGRGLTLEAVIATLAELLARANRAHAGGLDLHGLVAGTPIPPTEPERGSP